MKINELFDKLIKEAEELHKIVHIGHSQHCVRTFIDKWKQYKEEYNKSREIEEGIATFDNIRIIIDGKEIEDVGSAEFIYTIVPPFFNPLQEESYSTLEIKTKKKKEE